MKNNATMPCCYKLAVAIGLTAALFAFVWGLLGWWFGYGLEMIYLYGTVHVGYGPTFWGSVIGAIWAFIEAFVFVVIASWFYCGFCKCNKSCGSKTMGGSTGGGDTDNAPSPQPEVHHHQQPPRP